MGDKSGIEWTEATWNPTVGCTRVSAGCDNCYAVRGSIRMAGQFPIYQGLVNPGKRHFNGTVRTVPERLNQPLRWRKPRRIFVNSMSDLFHVSVPFNFIGAVFGVMAAAPQHTFQILTKRPDRMQEFITFMADSYAGPHQMMVIAAEDVMGGRAPGSRIITDAPWPLPNVWLGTSVENQQAADERIPHLVDTPAAVRFLSCEPLLGDLDIRRWLGGMDIVREQGGRGPVTARRRHGVGWVIVGGESGPGARPMDVAWVRSIVDQCQAPGVPVFVKQMGRQLVGDPVGFMVNFTVIGTDRFGLFDAKGGKPLEWPEDLRVREWPALTVGVKA